MTSTNDASRKRPDRSGASVPECSDSVAASLGEQCEKSFDIKQSAQSIRPLSVISSHHGNQDDEITPVNDDQRSRPAEQSAFSQLHGKIMALLGPSRDIPQRLQTSMTQNTLRLVDNPMIYVHNLDQSISDLHKEKLKGVVDLKLLQKAANILLTRPDLLDKRVKVKDDLKALIDPVDIEQIEQQQKCRFYQLPKDVLLIMVTCCFGALTQGWDQQSIAGANLQWPKAVGFDVYPSGKIKTLGDNWRFAAVNAITYFSASIVGSFVTDPLNQSFAGRRGALFIAGLFSFVSVIGFATSKTWQQLLATRFLLGIGMGAKSAIIPIYESEILPANRRGRLLISWQVFTATGICFGAAANIVLEGKWRWQAASGFIPAFPILILAFFCTESPRWLMQRDRYPEAYRSLLRLRVVPLLAATELIFIHYQNKVEKSLFYEPLGRKGDGAQDPFEAKYPVSTWPRRIYNLFAFSRNRRACLAAFVVMVSQQLSGINIFAFLAGNFFLAALSKADPNLPPPENSQHRSLLFAFGFGMANALFSVLAYWFIDSKGRRFLLIASISGMIPTLLATGLSLKLPIGHAARLPLMGFWLIFYVLYYSFGAGVVPFLYSSEIFPNDNREVGMSFAVFWNFLGAGLLALLVSFGIPKIGGSALLGIFSGLNVVSLILVWLLMPSTTQVAALEDMSYIFGVPTKEHIRYQAKESLPWHMRTLNNKVAEVVPCLPMRDAGQLRSLYRWWYDSEEVMKIEKNLSDDSLFHDEHVGKAY